MLLLQYTLNNFALVFDKLEFCMNTFEKSIFTEDFNINLINNKSHLEFEYLTLINSCGFNINNLSAKNFTRHDKSIITQCPY